MCIYIIKNINKIHVYIFKEYVYVFLNLTDFIHVVGLFLVPNSVHLRAELKKAFFR